jgi:hypothetical protein
MSTGYRCDRTNNVSDDDLSAFLAGTLSPSLRSLRGLIGPTNEASLKAVGIHTTYNLLGMFLMLRVPEDNTQTHCDKFWGWLRDTVGVSPAHCNGITLLIAKKADNLMPGLYRDSECLLSSEE